MKIVVTGAAGFIGSHLTDRLLAEGHEVTGIDMLRTPTNKPDKLDNLSLAFTYPTFTFVKGELSQLDLRQLLKEADVVFHQAGIAGVRDSWGDEFKQYVQMNIVALQRLLEACRSTKLKKFIYASSSSVYGGSTGLSAEDQQCRPISPYGLTKLSGEHLTDIYHLNYGIPTITLRYFTVYGPRQRTDMAFHKFLKSVLEGAPIYVYGDGRQIRDFTYVDDIIDANLLAMNAPRQGDTYNVGGGKQISVRTVLQVIQEVTGKPLHIRYLPEQPGDPKATGADSAKVAAELGYQPKISLRTGIEREWHYIKTLYGP